MQRKELVMILISNSDGLMKFHFTSELSRANQEIDLWFPLSDKNNLFAEVEAVLTMNGIADHVVSIEVIRKMSNPGSECIDYKIRYAPVVRGIVIHGVTVIHDISVLHPISVTEIHAAFRSCTSPDEVLKLKAEICPVCFGYGSVPFGFAGRVPCRTCLSLGSTDPLKFF